MVDVSSSPAQQEIRRELAFRLRLLVGRAGLTPRQFAARHNLPYSPYMLNQYFDLEALPPPRLIDTIVEHCDGDVDRVEELYDQVRGRAPLSPAGKRQRRGGAHRRKPAGPSPMRTRVLGSTAGVLGVVTISTIAVGVFGGEFAGAQERVTPPAPEPLPPAAIATSTPSLYPSPSRRPPERKTAEPRRTAKRTPRRPAPSPSIRLVGPNLIENGSFSSLPLPPWRGQGTNPLINNGRLLVEVFDIAGEALQDADVDSNEFSLEGGATYQLSFEASANPETRIGVTVQPDDADAVLFREIDLTPQTRRFAFIFTVEEDTGDTIVSFEMGGERQRRQIELDNVSLRRVVR